MGEVVILVILMYVWNAYLGEIFFSYKKKEEKKRKKEKEYRVTNKRRKENAKKKLNFKNISREMIKCLRNCKVV